RDRHDQGGGAEHGAEGARLGDPASRRRRGVPGLSARAPVGARPHPALRRRPGRSPPRPDRAPGAGQVSRGDGATMKAVLCKAWGPPDSLVVEELAPLAAEPGKVVVSVKAAGVNFPDVLIIQNRYQHKPPLPFSPGAEVAGVIRSVG